MVEYLCDGASPQERRTACRHGPWYCISYVRGQAGQLRAEDSGSSLPRLRLLAKRPTETCRCGSGRRCSATWSRSTPGSALLCPRRSATCPGKPCWCRPCLSRNRRSASPRSKHAPLWLAGRRPNMLHCGLKLVHLFFPGVLFWRYRLTCSPGPWMPSENSNRSSQDMVPTPDPVVLVELRNLAERAVPRKDAFQPAFGHRSGPVALELLLCQLRLYFLSARPWSADDPLAPWRLVSPTWEHAEQ